MKQSDAVQFLYRDLKTVTSDLVMKNYDLIFEEEMGEYFPFNDTIMEWLSKLYASEKYGAFEESKLSLYFEKEHPFLFMRDLAHINCWNMGYARKERKDHITGLMFSENPSYCIESTLALCRPSQIGNEPSQWFDFKQAMTNIEVIPGDEVLMQAWKACANYYLYFQLSQGQKIHREELFELMEPYIESIEIALHEGGEVLRQECGRITESLRFQKNNTLMDGFHC